MGLEGGKIMNARPAGTWTLWPSFFLLGCGSQEKTTKMNVGAGPSEGAFTLRQGIDTWLGPLDNVGFFWTRKVDTGVSEVWITRRYDGTNKPFWHEPWRFSGHKTLMTEKYSIEEAPTPEAFLEKLNKEEAGFKEDYTNEKYDVKALQRVQRR